MVLAHAHQDALPEEQPREFPGARMPGSNVRPPLQPADRCLQSVGRSSLSNGGPAALVLLQSWLQPVEGGIRCASRRKAAGGRTAPQHLRNPFGTLHCWRTSVNTGYLRQQWRLRPASLARKAPGTFPLHRGAWAGGGGRRPPAMVAVPWQSTDRPLGAIQLRGPVERPVHKQRCPPPNPFSCCGASATMHDAPVLAMIAHICTRTDR